MALIPLDKGIFRILKCCKAKCKNFFNFIAGRVHQVIFYVTLLVTARKTFPFNFMAVLIFELRTARLLGRCYTT
jgi:hypothetical protein